MKFGFPQTQIDLSFGDDQGFIALLIKAHFHIKGLGEIGCEQRVFCHKQDQGEPQYRSAGQGYPTRQDFSCFLGLGPFKQPGMFFRQME